MINMDTNNFKNSSLKIYNINYALILYIYFKKKYLAFSYKE